MNHWTMGRKIGIGFGVMTLLLAVVGVIAMLALDRLVESKNQVFRNHEALTDAAGLDAAIQSKAASLRGHLLAPNQQFLDSLDEETARIDAILENLAQRVDDPDMMTMLKAIREDHQAYSRAMQRILQAASTQTDATEGGAAFDREIVPVYRTLKQHLDRLVERAHAVVEIRERQSVELVSRTMLSLIILVAVAVIVAVSLALFLIRGLTTQIGSAVQAMQSSSAELQAAATQQAAGSKEQSSSMAEISTTIKELMSTSQQIAESAQRVARIAEDTRAAAGGGEERMESAQATMDAIRQQVDRIVEHMLDLGSKSQQIGGILEVINELTEQTNILAINASIEATGAGEAGLRFGVVAEEIRKLADRVGESAKEIRILIEEVRSAVNTSVMATESGSKAVSEGKRQFEDVRAALRRIVEGVETTTEASREIELSTKQQSTGVEQVNVGVANVAQASRENEASSGQVLDTAVQLNGLARELTRLIHHQATAR